MKWMHFLGRSWAGGAGERSREKYLFQALYNYIALFNFQKSQLY